MAGYWPWLSHHPGTPADKKSANKFLLGAALQWQIHAAVAWENARRLAEDVLHDPESLWDTIASIPFDDWMAKRGEYRLHHFRTGHSRVWTIGDGVRTNYGGDARNIWEGQSPEEVVARLRRLGAGRQISRMIVGALQDTEQIGDGAADVKADTHVRRVLGRVLVGEPLSVEQVTRETQQLHPDNP